MDKADPKKNDYKVVIADLGANPFSYIRIAFILMGIIPLLALFYIIIGKNALYRIFLGANGIIASVSIGISFIGFLFAYGLVINMVRKLLSYSSERKQSDEEKTEVLIGISHDLKTPLAVIKTGIQNMIDGIGGAINNAHTEIAHICLNAVDKTLIFINDLLDLSRIRFTKLNVRREYFNFAETVANEVNNVSDLARKNNQVLNLDIINKESGLWGDKEKLARVVMNLLSNALKYTPSGGSIKVVLTCDEDTARLSVINTGPGIPADKIERIFNKYERLKTTSMVEGSGLGLYIVKDIIDLHKGRIAVQSQPDKETQFDIILPRDLRGARRRSS